MSLNAAALEVLVAKGLSASDILDVARALEVRRDATAAERQQRRRDRLKEEAAETEAPHKAKTSRRDVTRDADQLPPNEYISNPPEPSEAKASEPPFDEKVVSAWNAGPARRGARKANKLDGARRKALSLRVREHGSDAVFAAIRGVEASDWHCGVGSNGWRADIGWLLKSPENFLKAVERAGDGPAPSVPADPVTQAAHLERLRSAPWMRGRENELPPLSRGGTA